MKSVTEKPAPRTCTAFAGDRKIASGTVLEVALKVKDHLQKDSQATVLIFDDATSTPVEVDLRGTREAVSQRLESAEKSVVEKKPGPGRPKLGVLAREVTLMPKHWEWLASQPGGASVTLRKLVEESMKKNRRRDEVRQAQDATYKFMTAMAGNLPGYEEALRAFYAKKFDSFGKLMRGWPKDLRDHIRKLAAPVMEA